MEPVRRISSNRSPVALMPSIDGSERTRQVGEEMLFEATADQRTFQSVEGGRRGTPKAKRSRRRALGLDALSSAFYAGSEFGRDDAGARLLAFQEFMGEEPASDDDEVTQPSGHLWGIERYGIPRG